MNLPRRCIGSTAWIITKVSKKRKGKFSSAESSPSTSFPAKQHLPFAESAVFPQPTCSRVTWLFAHVLSTNWRQNNISAALSAWLLLPCHEGWVRTRDRALQSSLTSKPTSLVQTPGGVSRDLSCLPAHQGLWQAQPGTSRATKAIQCPKSGEVFARLCHDIGQV